MSEPRLLREMSVTEVSDTGDLPESLILGIEPTEKFRLRAVMRRSHDGDEVKMTRVLRSPLAVGTLQRVMKGLCFWVVRRLKEWPTELGARPDRCIFWYEEDARHEPSIS